MPGVIFLIVVPTANFEQEILNEIPAAIATNLQHTVSSHGGNNLNINLPDKNAVLRLEVELRDKNARRRPNYRNKNVVGDRIAAFGGGGRPGGGGGAGAIGKQMPQNHPNPNNFFVPMEKVLEELLTKLEIDHVTWSSDKKGCYYTIIFPLQAGDPCETTLHCLTQLGIGIKAGSSVSVIPCSVTFDAIKENAYDEEIGSDGAENSSKWNEFVDSIKSKLTVKQVVDGVRAGGQLSFDYLALIVTADSLAALGLIENNAPNITAAMLVSPLMGPVMSITFGTIINDRTLIKSGFIALGTGMLVSLLFGFIFGLIVGTTEMPWGFGDWPTEEMKGRGNARSLWMGVAWALTSGTGVALALLLGATGPLIGVAISASLLPPVVNCGLYWALACIWLIYPGIKMPHIKGEEFTGNTSYVPLYTNYIPTEFLVSGIVSGMLTVINVCCIFITAIITLKIKEVAAPYIASPDLRRFWETDIRVARQSNTIRRKQLHGSTEKLTTTLDNIIENDSKNGNNLGTALEQALKEAADDETLRKVKRMSYSANAADEITKRLGISSNAVPNNTMSPNTIRNSKINADLSVLDKLVSSLLERQKQLPPTNSKESTPLQRLRSLSFRGNRRASNKAAASSSSTAMLNESNIFGNSTVLNGNEIGIGQPATAMPTILESGISSNVLTSLSQQQSPGNSSSLDRRNGGAGVRQIINSIKNAPHRFSHGMDHHRLDEESSNLTQNMLD